MTLRAAALGLLLFLPGAPVVDGTALSHRSTADSSRAQRDHQADLLLFEAETWLKENNWRTALGILRRVVAGNPERVDAWETLAGACRLALASDANAPDSLVSEALDAYRAVLELQPRNRGALDGTRALAARYKVPAGAAQADLARRAIADGRIPLGELRLRIAFELGDTSRATRALLFRLEDSLGAGAPTPERTFYRGRVRLVEGDHPGAEFALRQALEMDSTGPGYRTWLAIALHRQRKSDEALVLLERALEDDPGDPAARFHAGAILFDREQYEPAARQLAPVADEHRYRGEAARLLGLALSHVEGAEEEAAFYLERAVREGAADPSIPCVLAEQYVRLSHWKEARRNFRKCFAARPDYPTVLLGLGLTADHDGDHREAVERLEAFRAGHPVTPSVLIRLGLAYLKLGEPDSAAARFREAIMVDSTLARLHPGELDARQVLEVTFFILMAGQNVDDGIAVGEYLVASAPEDPADANNLAMAYADAGKNLDRALELALLANRKSPDQFGYLDTLGWTYVRLKRYGEARRALERALELGLQAGESELAEIYFHLGSLSARTGERETAIRYLQQSLAGASPPKVERSARELLQSLEEDGPAGPR